MKIFIFAILAVWAAAPAVAEFRSFSLAAKGSWDAGTKFVSDVETGFGIGGGLRGAFGNDRREWVVCADADIAGFTGEADGDPILQLTGSVLRRSYFESDGGNRPFWFAGAGVGVLGIAGSGVAFPLQAGLGMAFGRDSGVNLSLYNRFSPIYGDGDPAWDFINSVGIELALRIGR
jgi:hypothetical protein